MRPGQDAAPPQLARGDDGRYAWQQSAASSAPPEASREAMRASFEEAQREVMLLSQQLSSGGSVSPAVARAAFNAMDQNHDGAVSRSEFNAALGLPGISGSPVPSERGSRGLPAMSPETSAPASRRPSSSAGSKQDADQRARPSLFGVDLQQELGRIQGVLAAVPAAADRACLVAENPRQVVTQGPDRARLVAENPPQGPNRACLVGESSSKVASQDKTDPVREQLLVVGSSFKSLDVQVQEDLRRRKELEQIRTQEIVVSLNKLAKTLNIETSRRQKQHESLREHVDSLLENMVTRVQNRIVERVEQLSNSLQSLSDRCATLELGIQQFKGELPSKLQVQTTELRQGIYRVAHGLASDRKRREEQDVRLLHELEEVENKLDILVQQELARQDRETEGVQLIIEELASSQSRATTKHQALVTTSIEELKEQLRLEEQTRDSADDHVVQAINSFVVTMHRSLKTANS